MKRLAPLALSLALACVWGLASPQSAGAAVAIEAPASPFELLRPRLLVPHFLDAGPACVDLLGGEDRERPGDSGQSAESAESAELDAVSARLRALRRKARVATRLERATLRLDLEKLARKTENPLTAVCVHLDSARLALRMGFGPEASAELRRAARVLPEASWPAAVRDLSNYLEVEAFVAMRRGGEGIDAALSAADSQVAELALAARLRIFDLRTRSAVILHPEPKVASTAATPPVGFRPEAAGPPVLAEELALPIVPAAELPAREAKTPETATAEPATPETEAAVAAESTNANEAPPAARVPERLRAAYALWKELDELLNAARSHDFDMSSWAVRAGEHALLGGRLSSAHQWFAIAEGVPESRRLGAIRKADVLMQLDRPDDARRTLQRVVSNAREAEVRHLARIRLARYGLLTEGAKERTRLLELAARSEHPVIASVARDQLAIEYLENENPDAALAVLRKNAYAGPTLHHVPRFAATLDAALSAAVDGRDCSGVLGRLARSWELFMRHATKPEPFVAVGECFVGVGMSNEALLVYRAIARSFGVDSVPNLSWRLASASLVSNDLPAARASLRASLRPLGGDVPLSAAALKGEIRIPDEEAARWWWLAAELATREARDSEALAIQLALLGSDQLPESLRASVEANLAAHLARRPAQASRVDPLLAESLGKNLPGDAPERALARIQLVDRVWGRGEHQAAGAEYRRVHTAVDAPTPRNRAEYRGAVAVDPADTSRELLRAAAENEPFNAWSRLSRVELRMMGLRESVGFASQVLP